MTLSKSPSIVPDVTSTIVYTPSGTVFIQTNEKAVVELYDLLGNRLLTKEIINNDQLDISKYAAGVYVLRNRNDGETYKITRR